MRDNRKSTSPLDLSRNRRLSWGALSGAERYIHGRVGLAVPAASIKAKESLCALSNPSITPKPPRRRAVRRSGTIASILSSPDFIVATRGYDFREGHGGHA